MKFADYLRTDRPVRLAENLLLFLTPPVIAAFAYILAFTITFDKSELTFRLNDIRVMLEYAVASLLVLFCGALVADAAEVEGDLQK